jgi:hypothetical protein
VALGFAGAMLGSIAIATDALGAGRLWDRALAKIDRFVAGPVPDRPAPVTILVTEPPGESTGPDPITGPVASPPVSSPPTAPSTADPGATPAPPAAPARLALDVDIVADHGAVFAHELKDTWCAPAGVQMTLAVLGRADTSDAFQRQLQGRVREWESYADSRNGNWGPAAMVLALDAYGARGYEVRAYRTRQAALAGAAKAILQTWSPSVLLTWRGAHTWVMTGFRADADPTVFADATISGTYILDPWYPDVSSIWGPSDPPGTFQDDAEMIRNYLPWKRPEGRYPDRDGLFIAVVPTVRAVLAP